MPAETTHPVVAAARRARDEDRAARDGHDAHAVSLPVAALPELHRAVAETAGEEVLQVVPFTPEDWSPTAFEHTLWRATARDGLKVQRLYVVPHLGLAREALTEQTDLDRAAGVDCRVLFVTRIPEGQVTAAPDALWIVDQSAIARAQPSPGGSRDDWWTVSDVKPYVRDAQRTWERLWAWSDPPDAFTREFIELEEPLVLSADLMHEVADVLCTGDHVDRESCSWYHGAWQYLRLFNMVSTPTWHSDFYLRSLTDALRNAGERPTVAITGTADYSMFAYVDAAARTARRDVETLVLDLCATPLFACRWYAKRVRRPVTALAEDLLEARLVQSAGQVDVICTDAFLTRFESRQVERVVKTWHDLLVPGGKLVTTIRVHSRSPRGRDAAAAIRDFRERAEQRAKRWQAFLGLTPAEIADLAEKYARQMTSSNLGDSDVLLGHLEDGGLEVVHSELAEVPGELYPTTYLEVVCRRKEERTSQR